MNWYVYILECSDGSLYTGATNDLESRIKAHNKGAASKYTRSRLPVRLVWSMQAGYKKNALLLERQIKSYSRSEKLQLIKQT